VLDDKQFNPLMLKKYQKNIYYTPQLDFEAIMILFFGINDIVSIGASYVSSN